MFIFILQVRHMLDSHSEFYLFAAFSATVWALWLIKVVLSRRYKPYTGTFTGTASVVIPVVDEPEDLFRDVLGRIVAQRPHEVIVVINGARNETLERVCDEFAPHVRWTHTPIPGKRNAVKVGTEASTGEITVLVDSDTVWTPGTLPELLRPFADESVGGVTTRQRILDPERSWITRWADWLENNRALYSMPAQSVLGQVGCLPGRTIAFRRNILVRVMEKFMTEKFLGVFLEVSDDRTLTNLTLKEGYRTVYQYTSLVYTDAPLQIKKLFKQQLRWARGSQYNTLRMLPWMVAHAPVLAIFFVTDILLPFMLVGTIAGWVYRAVSGTGVNLYQAILQESVGNSGWLLVIGLMLVSSVLSMAVRQLRHLQEKPSDFWRLPLFIVVSSLFLMPVRLLGFLRMAHVAGWGTRAGAYDRSTDQLFEELRELEGTQAPVDVVDRPGAPAAPPPAGGVAPSMFAPSSPLAPLAPPGVGGAAPLGGEEVAGQAGQAVAAPAVAAPAVAVDVRPQPAPAARRPRKRVRRRNPLVLVPYAIATVILGLEALLYV
ncbi:glycosyl transferase family 2 [Xylanimonas oleitrophica]|uniref:Glycosyl transferase family 2 n=1 Tax=Xylanimonas oleitrophica TaxID=2607479 RepID=A0A2W5WMB5_9MICO|nr:glycosyltransferase family 2 protein [Xylanimonas oleitrophica]PZR52467.1 glycosyl transferase family 2 [Xylanimonas oleitrophica]